MITFVIVIHVIICCGLIGLVLIQRGRGSGLVESLSGVESVFGTKTNTFLTRTTTILSILFFITCLSLAILSVRQSKSLMRSVKQEGAKTSPVQPTPPKMPDTGSQASEGQK
ncbi:MAG TPA: preprotein translocase subunit SecG [Candidatus Margulisiibacteriota bacterium]|nr:preprotein translocase subunit SecG [Candidatus Margulisiibacteriota bacterium]